MPTIAMAKASGQRLAVSLTCLRSASAWQPVKALLALQEAPLEGLAAPLHQCH